MEIYVMSCLSNTEEYISIRGDIAAIKQAVIRSDIQFLNHDAVQFDVSENGGLEIPDYFVYEGVPFISNRFRYLMEINGIDYVFWKEAIIKSEVYGISERFWIMNVPRVDCVDPDKSQIRFEEWDFSDGLLPLFKSTSCHVARGRLGRFDIFRLLGIMDNRIFLTDKMYNAFKSEEIRGVGYIKSML